MVDEASPVVREARRGVGIVIALQVLCVALVTGWFATGHASAPDAGLQQLDLLSLDERVPGLQADRGRPTMVVVTCDGRYDRQLDERYGLYLVAEPALARRLALPKSLRPTCQDGYVLLDGESRVRYRTYDRGWRDHAFEQEVLLGHLDGH
jgi:hypothetical protein